MTRFQVCFIPAISNRIANIKAIRLITGEDLAGAKAIVDKFAGYDCDTPFDMVVTGDQFAMFYAYKNAGQIHEKVILSNTRIYHEPEQKLFFAVK